jgi:predicted nuclease with TOPRIM domain
MSKVKASPMTTADSPASVHWLDLTEILSLVGSGVGLVVAIVSQQAIAAALPLTLTVSLNVVNRKRFQQEIQNENRAAIAQVQSLLKSLPEPADIQTLAQQIRKLDYTDRVINGQLEALKHQVQIQLKPEQIAALQDAIASLRADFTEIQQRNVQRQELENQLQGQLQQLYDRLDRLEAERQPYEEVRRVENAIAVLHRDLTQLKQQVNTSEQSDWQHIQMRVSQLQIHLKQMETGLVPIKRKQTAILKQLLPRIVKLLNEVRQTPRSVPMQKVVVHRPPPPPLLHHSGYRQPTTSGTNAGNSKPVHQPQRQGNLF